MSMPGRIQDSGPRVQERIPYRRAGGSLGCWTLDIGYWILISLAALLGFASPASAVSGRWEKLEDAVLGDGYMDGDSFHVRHGGKDIVIRLYYVDTPETDKTHEDRNADQADYFNISPTQVIPLGNKGKVFTRRTLSGEKFTVWTRWEDAMGSGQKRYFGVVQVGKDDLAELLVANGLARVYGASTVLPDGTTMDQKFAKLRQLERRAKAKRLGGWAKKGKKDRDQTDTVEGMFDIEPEEDTTEPGYVPAWIEDEEEVGVYEGQWPNVPTVAFLRAEAFINSEQFEDAEIEMRKLVARFPEHVQKARIEFYLALSVAMQERFEEAVRRFKSWLQAYPSHILVPDVQYWMPISLYYDGKYEEALPYFDEYARKNPMSVYAPEATYRAACCRYALEDYERTAADIAAWLERRTHPLFRHEAAIMRGDALAVLGEFDAAKEAYHPAATPPPALYFAALT